MLREVSMYPKQRGITMIGWLFLLTPFAIVGYAGIRLAPIYLNYMKVARSLTQTAKDFANDDSFTAAEVRNTLEKHFDVEAVDFPKVQDVIIKRDGANWIEQVTYEDTAPLFSNIKLLVRFDKRVDIK
jgi:hypothetical protein